MACTLFPGVGAVLLVLLVNQLLNPQCRGGDLCGRSTGEDESLQHGDERRWCKVAGKMFDWTFDQSGGGGADLPSPSGGT